MLHLDIKKVCILLNVELPKYEEVENIKSIAVCLVSPPKSQMSTSNEYVYEKNTSIPLWLQKLFYSPFQRSKP